MRHDSMTSLAASPPYAATLASSYFNDLRYSVSSNATSQSSILSSISHTSLPSVATSYSSVSSTTASRPAIYPITSRSHQSTATQVPFDYNPFYQHVAKPTPDASTTLLKDLKVVLENSNLSDCWEDMAGVLLWIGLTFGAASHKNGNRVLKKWYSALSMRVSIVLCFQHPEAIHSAMLTMGLMIEILGKPDSSSTANATRAKKNGEAPGKKRKTRD